MNGRLRLDEDGLHFIDAEMHVDGAVEVKDCKMTDGSTRTFPVAEVLKLKGRNWDGREIEAEVRLKVKNP